MTEGEKRPRRWIAFLLNLLFAPVGYVYAGRLVLAFFFMAVCLSLALGLYIWTILSPPGIYIFVEQLGEAGLWIWQPVINLVAATHAAAVVRPRKLKGFKLTLLAVSVWAGALLVSFGFALLIRVFYQPYSIPSQSMAPTLEPGDVILARNVRCGSFSPAPGAVVVVKPGGPAYIWRVVAAPGQTVQMLDGRLWIDGKAVQSAPDGQAEGDLYRETLPNGAAYRAQDLGQGYMADDMPPMLVPAGHWFMLGDNRDNANDSRFVGAIPQAQICGTAVKILHSRDQTKIGAAP